MRNEDIIKLFNENTTANLPGIITIRTEVKLNKKDKTKTIVNEVSPVFKVQTQRVKFNAEYEQAVNEALEAAGEKPGFQAQKAKWGNEMLNGSIVIHEGEHYVRFISEGADEARYETMSGKEIKKDQFEMFLPPARPNNSPVAIRKVKLSNVLSVALTE